jgi:hypothetical protein
MIEATKAAAFARGARSVPPLDLHHDKRCDLAPLQASAAVEEIVYDAASGIKTLLLSDGSVREEPFDPVTLPMIKAAQGRAKVRIRIVDEDVPVEPRSPVEADPAAPSRSPTEDQSSAPVKPGSGMDE